VSLRALAALALATQGGAILWWFAAAAPGPILASLLGSVLALLAALALALACGWRRAPFSVALASLLPLTIAIGEFQAQPEARLPAAVLGLSSLAAVLLLGIAARRKTSV
jgi:hypothetical protein